MINRPCSVASFVIAKQALHHCFTITKEATEQDLFIIGGVIQFLGVPVIRLITMNPSNCYSKRDYCTKLRPLLLLGASSRLSMAIRKTSSL